MRFYKYLILSAATLMLPLLGHATPLTKIPASGLTVDGLTFTNFSYQLTHEGDATPHKAKSIDVSTITMPGNGIQFSSDFTAVAKKGAASFADATIGFKVSAASAITSIGLDFDGYATGMSIASVSETVFDTKGDMLGSLEVSCLGKALGGACTYTDTLNLKGLYTSLYIVKDMSATSFGGVAGFSFVDQVFDPTTATPEPASFAMLGAGLIGVAGLLRRRNKKA